LVSKKFRKAGIEFSVVIMTYNRKRLLLRCLQALLLQDYPKDKYEILIVDDGSSDYTREYISGIIENNPRIRYFRHSLNIGVASARNTGIRMAKGRYIAFLADDYIVPKDYLLRTHHFFSQNPDAKIMTCNISGDSNGWISGAQTAYHNIIQNRLLSFEDLRLRKTFKYVFFKLPAKIQSGSLIQQPRNAAVFERNLISKYMFKDGLRMCEDVVLSNQLKGAGIRPYLNNKVTFKCSFPKRLSVAMKKEYIYASAGYTHFQPKPSCRNVIIRIIKFIPDTIIDTLITLRQNDNLYSYISLSIPISLLISSSRLGQLNGCLRALLAKNNKK
jgi:glycosyltransferase involved in cell wall biosynthesis